MTSSKTVYRIKMPISRWAATGEVIASEGRAIVWATVAVGSHGKQLLRLLGQLSVARVDYFPD
jgi:hypothetical protein